MTPAPATSSRAARPRAILFLIVAVVLFGAVDGLSKMLVAEVSFGQIMLARYGLSLIVLLGAAGPANWPGLFRTRRAGQQIVRGATPVMIGGSMVFAVKYLPLAEATVIMFAGPFLVVALSGWLLKEHVAASSWAGVALGFAAVLMVARPGLGALSLYTVFPATAAVFYALFQLQSRHLGAAGERPLTTLAWTLSVGTLAMLPVALAQWVPPTPEGWLLLAALGATFGGGQYYLAKAFALAPANVLTPFSYVQIVSAALFGLVVFHDVPDFWTIAGAILILGAGAYVFSRGRR